MFSCCIPEGNVAFYLLPPGAPAKDIAGVFLFAASPLAHFPSGICARLRLESLTKSPGRCLHHVNARPAGSTVHRQTFPAEREQRPLAFAATVPPRIQHLFRHTGCGSICQCARVQPLKSCAAASSLLRHSPDLLSQLRYSWLHPLA